jgi:hypothetical protein
MCLGRLFDPKLLSESPESLLSACFREPKYIDSLTYSYLEVGNKKFKQGKYGSMTIYKYWFFISVHRKSTCPWQSTGDCLSATFETKEECESTARTLIDKLKTVVKIEDSVALSKLYEPPKKPK